MLEIFQSLLLITQEMGYAGIVILMTIESSFVPFPSELVVPPAAYLAAQGKLNIFLVIASGILGSLLGAVINYLLAFSLGRKIIYLVADHKVTNIVLVNKEKIKKAENFFLKYGKISTFLGRLVPAVRQLISIPAGFSRMPFGSFVFYTFLGSGIWTVVLALLGYFLGSNQGQLAQVYHSISFFLKFGALLAVIIIGLAVFKKIKNKKTI